MSKKWEKVTSEFDAISEDGQKFRLLVYTTMIETRPGEPPVKGLKCIRTSEGQLCNRIDNNTYEVVSLKLRLNRM